MPSPIDDIKARLDLVELIQSYVRLNKAGINYKANCPFHTEKTPSFFVSPTRQMWHCFGCGKGGDHFKFVMEIEGHDFPEALKILAQRAGIILKREDPAIRSERNRMYDLCEEAAKVFEKSLTLTPAVKNYLKKRGVADQTILEFRVGFAPQSWDFLLNTLTAKGFRKDEIEKSGLAIKSEDNGSWYDRFRSRIIFPITDGNGRVTGFSGRIFGQPTTNNQRQTTDAKYINTPQTLIYDKSQALYGFDKAKQEIRSKNQVVVVEGQMDCIMSHQAGVKNAIAVSGTALTPQQLKILRRLCDTIISSFDTDAAGDSATKRSLALASEFEFERKIAAIPSGKDPADTVLDNPKLWLETIEKAKPVVEFYFEKAFREYNPKTADGKKAISSLLLPFVSELTNEIEKSHWVKRLAEKLGVSEEAIWKELKRNKNINTTAYSKEPQEKIADQVPTRREILEERLLATMTLVKDDVRARELANHHLVFASSENQHLFETLQKNQEHVMTASLAGPLSLLRFKAEVISQITKNLEEEFIACKHELEKESIKEQLLKIGAEVERLEREGSRAMIASLLQDFHILSKKLKGLT